MIKQLSSSKQIKKIKKEIQKQTRTAVDVPIQQEESIEKEPITFILDHVVLEIGYMKSNKVLLNYQDHSRFIQKRLSRDPNDFRPDILHQALLTLLDSPLNKAGLLKIFIHTDRDQYIEINPITKIPRTFARFCGMIVKLLETKKIVADEQCLLEVHNEIPFNNEYNKFLPNHKMPFADMRLIKQFWFTVLKTPYVITTSHKAKLVDLKELAKHKKNVTFIVYAVGKGNPGLECENYNECVSVSRYQLSTANCLSKICDCYEQLYNIL